MNASAGNAHNGSANRESLLKRKPVETSHSDEPVFEVFEESIYENQRWIGGGANAWSSKHLMLLDRPEWSSASGESHSKSQVKLPEGWTWADECWHIDTSNLGDSGWCYGVCFGAAVGNQYYRFVPLPGNVLHFFTQHFFSKPRPMDFTRWRRWYRRRVRRVASHSTCHSLVKPQQVSSEQIAVAAKIWHEYAPPRLQTTQTQSGTPLRKSNSFGLQLEVPRPQSPAALHTCMFAEPDYLCCIITGELLHSPVVSLTSGHTYEHDTLMALIAANDVCPMTRRKLSLRSVVRNRALEFALRAWGAFQSAPPSDTPPSNAGQAAQSIRPKSVSTGDDWLLVTSLSAPTFNTSDDSASSSSPTGAAPHSSAALTAVPLQAAARASGHAAAADGGSDATSAIAQCDHAPLFLQCPLAPPGQLMRRPVITAAGWTYDEQNLLLHFSSSLFSARMPGGAGGRCACYTDPITGLPLDPRSPYVPNVAMQDMLDAIRGQPPHA